MLPVVLHLGGALAGFFFGPNLNRVCVFIDAQNVYMGARDSFFERSDPRPTGQIAPMALGVLLCGRANPYQPSGTQRTLEQVRIYTGRPDPSKDPSTYAAHRRQCAAWERSGAIVIPRSLRYPGKWPKERAQEKGIDVQLAIDFVAGAIDGTYDTGIISSTDTDLLPAIEFVANRYGQERAETAAWYSDRRRSELRSQTITTWCHRLKLADYSTVGDPRDYNIP